MPEPATDETAGAEAVIDLAARTIHDAISLELGNTVGSELGIVDVAAARALGRRGQLADLEQRAEIERLGARLDAARLNVSDAERIAEGLRAERDQLKARNGKALELHSRDTDGSCKGCGLDAYEEPIRWPCATARALQADQPAEPNPRCCIGTFANGAHAYSCRERCQDCKGDPDGPYRCRCRDDEPAVHDFVFVASRDDGKGYVRCSCGWTPEHDDIAITETDAEVAFNAHLPRPLAPFLPADKAFPEVAGG